MPIKRNKNIVPLSREHHATLLFCWKLKSGIQLGIDPERIQRYVNYFYEHELLPHFKKEEDLLFTDHQDEMVQKALQDHQSILSKVKEVKNCHGEHCYSVFDELAALVNDHTRYEERTLFPYLESKIPEEELERIGKILEGEDHGAEENYNDQFWIQ